MGRDSKIAWTDDTFNPVWGCTKVDPGCEHCYAETFDKRVGGAHWGPHPEFRAFGDKHWNEPRKWDREAKAAGVRRRVFCASMTDVFHRDMPHDVTARLWDLIDETRNLDWLLLTKRADLIRERLPWSSVPWSNVWLGVSVCEPSGLWRVDALRSIPATVRFLSMEPLLAPMPSFPLGGIDWVIVGAESGARHRPMEIDWVRDIRDHCVAASVRFFLKQYVRPNGTKIETPELDGRRWTEFPK